MDINEAIEHALDGNALLFLGAGFSIGAESINGKKILDSKELALKLCELSGNENTKDLDVAAQEYLEHTQNTDEVINLLKSYYEVSAVAEHHNVIASIPWRIVFTTNYDNVYELASSNNSKSITPVTLSDTISSLSVKDKLIVHINGRIKKLTKNTIYDEFRLTNTSYLTEAFLDSTWIEKFRNELNIAKVIIFIGYSMYDIDIQKILYNKLELREKTFFINKNTTNTRKLKTINRFGNFVGMTCQEFTQTIKSIKLNYTPTNPTESLLAFEKIDISSYSYTQATTTTEDIYRLFMMGNYDKNKIHQSILSDSQENGSSDKQETEYYIFRKELYSILDMIKNSTYQNIIIQSNFGNGKTLLIEGIIAKCTLANITCYKLKINNEHTLRDIDTILKNTGKQVIVLENYSRYKKLVKIMLSQKPTNTILLLSERTANNEVTIPKFPEFYHDSTHYITLDTLDTNTIEQLFSLFDKNALWKEFSGKTTFQKHRIIQEQCSSSMAGVLLGFLHSDDIQARIHSICEGLQDKSIYKDIVVVACLFNIIGYPIKFDQVLKILNKKGYNQITFETNPVIKHFLDFKTSSISIKSAVFSKILLHEFATPDYICDMSIKIYKYCVIEQDYTTELKELRKDMEKFSTLQSLFPQNNNVRASDRFYEAIRSLNNNQNSFHFWLQFAISKTVFKQYDLAFTQFQTAKGLTEKWVNKPIMIQNYFSRFLLERAIHSEGFSSYDNFIEANTIIQEQIHQEHTTMHFPYRSTELYCVYYRKVYTSLTEDNITHFLQQIRNILKIIQRLPANLCKNKHVCNTQNDLSNLEQEILKALQKNNP